MTTPKVNETSEERLRREDSERAAKEMTEDIKLKAKDETILEKRLDETQKQKDARRAKELADEYALNNLGRVQEIADSMERDHENWLQRRDNAIRRLRGMMGNPNQNPEVEKAIKAVADRFDIEISKEGLKQPKTDAKKGDANYPFAT